MNVICLDLEGLVLQDKKLGHGMIGLLQALRQRHKVVISTSVPQVDAVEMVEKADVPVDRVFGDLTEGVGKRYSSIAKAYNIPSRLAPECMLVVGHELMDAPVDLNLVFVLSMVRPDCHAAAIEEAVSLLTPNFVHGYYMLSPRKPFFNYEHYHESPFNHKPARILCVTDRFTSS